MGLYAIWFRYCGYYAPFYISPFFCLSPMAPLVQWFLFRGKVGDATLVSCIHCGGAELVVWGCFTNTLLAVVAVASLSQLLGYVVLF